VNVGQKGIRGIEAASRERNHGKFQFLLDVTSLTVHKECRRQYTHPDSIERAKRGSAEDTVGVEDSFLKQRLWKPKEAFDFHCQDFCAEKIDIIGERREEEACRRTIYQVETLLVISFIAEVIFSDLGLPRFKPLWKVNL